MKWLAFSRKFHPSWHKMMKPFIESPACDLIFSHLKSRSVEGHKIMPISHNTFKAFEIPLNQIKVVILGGNPYDAYIEDITIANGLLLDCSNLKVPSYELRNFYRGIEVEVFNGLSMHYRNVESIDYLTKQGVLMLNSALTTEEDKSHEVLWEDFTTHVIEGLDELDIPIILIGSLAKTYLTSVVKSQVFTLADIPGTIGAEWDTGNVFQKVDEILEDNDKDSIMWLNVDVPF